MSLGDDIYAASMLNALTAANLARAEAEEERDALRAKLDAIHRWVSRHAEIVDSDPEHPPYLNEAAEILQEFFDGKEPDA